MIKSASGQKNTKNFWWPKIPKTTAFKNPAKPLMTGKRIDLAGIKSFRLGRHEKIYFKCRIYNLAAVEASTEQVPVVGYTVLWRLHGG